MKKIVFLYISVSILLLISSCSWIESLFYTPVIGTKFQDNSDQSRQRAVDQASIIQGMYFGELEIVAYQYSPGFTDTGGFGYNGVGDGTGAQQDWAYFVILQSGHEMARDIVLQSDEIVDIAAFNDEYQYSLNDDFCSEYDSFSIDFLEVNVYRSGIVIEDKYYGMNASTDEHPLHRYEELSELPLNERNTNIEGFPSENQSFSVFFARDDWFPEAVLVQLNYDEETHIFEYAWSSKTLTQEQITKLESLATNGTGRRFYGNLVIIPYDGPIILEINRSEESGYSMKHPTAIIKFDFTDLLSETTLSDYLDNNNIDAVDIIYRLKDDIPFGLSVEFIDEY